MQSLEDYNAVRRLLDTGLSDYAIARETGVPRSTVLHWRRDDASPRRVAEAAVAGWGPPDPAAYCYVLGIYLGGGHLTKRSPRAAVITGAALIAAFPQHGPGKKHERPIVLIDWQRELTTAHPAALIRGLIHSDGCRTVNRFKTKLPSGRVAEYEYPPYFFSNLSADIRGIFCEHCDLLGIRYTGGHERNVSIAHKASVAILETLVGAKK